MIEAQQNPLPPFSSLVLPPVKRSVSVQKTPHRLPLKPWVPRVVELAPPQKL